MSQTTIRPPSDAGAKAPAPPTGAPGPGIGQPQAAGPAPPPIRRRARVLPVLVTLLAIVVAAVLARAMWVTFMEAPWTRDGRVRVYVVSIAPEVGGQIVSLPVADNQFVHKGDVLFQIDQRDYAVALATAKARLDQARTDMENKLAEARRRERLSDLSTSAEERENYNASALAARAALEAAQASLGQAHINMDRTTVRSPVNGWVTNLLSQQGNYANAGQRVMSVVNADSFWVDGYFEETTIAPIHEGDPAEVWLMGYRQVLHGHVESLARGITVSNAAPDATGLANVNPIFTWVRLAQRVPVRVKLDNVPAEVRLVQGMTATVQVDRPDSAHPRVVPAPPAAPPAPVGPTP